MAWYVVCNCTRALAQRGVGLQDGAFGTEAALQAVADLLLQVELHLGVKEGRLGLADFARFDDRQDLAGPHLVAFALVGDPPDDAAGTDETRATRVGS